MPEHHAYKAPTAAAGRSEMVVNRIHIDHKEAPVPEIHPRYVFNIETADEHHEVEGSHVSIHKAHPADFDIPRSSWEAVLVVWDHTQQVFTIPVRKVYSLTQAAI